jgi:lipid-binding SYLF domain-containing protein
VIQSVFKCAVAVVVVNLMAGWALAQDRQKQLERIQGAGTVLNEIMAAPDKGIPEEILGSAKCVAIVPSLLKAGFVFGGEYGHGVASCRTDKGWSAPAFFGIKGGTFGLQIGGQAVDLVMLIMNDSGMRNLLSSKFELGADASVATGPVGRHAQGATDWKLSVQALTYSRSRGVFAGLTLKGALIMQDTDDTRIFYGRMVPYSTLLTGGLKAPVEAQAFLTALDRHAPVAKTQKPVSNVGNASAESKTPDSKTSDSKNSERKIPASNAPESNAPASKGSEGKGPESKTPESTVPDGKTPGGK